jgi:hypothetical protein
MAVCGTMARGDAPCNRVLPKNVGLKPRPLGRLYAILRIEAKVFNLSKNPVA